jgi:hypothetical protein
MCVPGQPPAVPAGAMDYLNGADAAALPAAVPPTWTAT